MAARTFGKFSRGSVTIKDYFAWRNETENKTACAGDSNPAFLSSNASKGDIEAAMQKCASCPLVQGCNFFANTKHFKEFDGVMGGQLFVNDIDDEKIDDVKELELAVSAA